MFGTSAYTRHARGGEDMRLKALGRGTYVYDTLELAKGSSYRRPDCRNICEDAGLADQDVKEMLGDAVKLQNG